MNLLIDWLPAEGWPRLAADAVWQSTLAGLVGLACIRLFARRPATRACLSLCAVLAAAGLPLVSAGARLSGWGVLKPTAIAAPTELELAAVPVRMFTNPATAYQSMESPAQIGSVTTKSLDATGASAPPLQTAPSASEQARSQIDVSTIFLAIWFVLSAVLLIRLLASAWQTQRLLREAAPCDDRVIYAALQSAAERMRIATPRVFVSKAVELPTVFAFGRGVVLIPASEPPSSIANEDCTNPHDRWFAIFCHELGHVRRRDGWNRLAAEIALVVLPWQALVWFLRREYLRNAEEACDDWALASGVNPIDLASVLTDFVPAVSRLNLGATIMSTDAKSRILRLLALRETPRPRTTWLQMAAIAMAACIVVASLALAQRPGADRGKQVEQTEAKNTNDSAAANSREAPNEEARYVIEPPDVLRIEAMRIVRKQPYRIGPLDVLRADVKGALPPQDISNMLYVVEPGGALNLGAAYGKVNVTGLSVDEARDAVEAQLRRTLKKPQVSLSLYESSEAKQIVGLYTVGPDGYLNLGTVGQVYVAGMTVPKAQDAIQQKLSKHFEKPIVSIDVRSRRSSKSAGQRKSAATKSVYVLEPPDIVLIEPIRLLPKGRQRIERLDQLEIAVLGTPENAPIKGSYQVDADGEISLGPQYGHLQVAGLTAKEAIQKLDEHLSRTLSEPAVAVRITDKSKNQQVSGKHLIGPDGSINLGTFGQVYVTGMTINEAREAIELKLIEHFDKPSVAVTVQAYNSKVYYVIVEGKGQGDTLHRFPITGNETVLDALAQANTTIRDDMSIWIARPSPDGGHFQVLPVKYDDITGKGETATNYQILPGDRVFLHDADRKPAPAATK